MSRFYAVQPRKWQSVKSFTSATRNGGGITGGGNDAPRPPTLLIVQSDGLWKNRGDTKPLLLFIHKVKRSSNRPLSEKRTPTRSDTFVDCQFRSSVHWYWISNRKTNSKPFSIFDGGIFFFLLFFVYFFFLYSIDIFFFRRMYIFFYSICLILWFLVLLKNIPYSLSRTMCSIWRPSLIFLFLFRLTSLTKRLKNNKNIFCYYLKNNIL